MDLNVTWSCEHCGHHRATSGDLHRDTVKSWLEKARYAASFTWLIRHRVCTWCFWRLRVDTGPMGHTTMTDRRGMEFCRDCLSCKPRIGWRHECRGVVRIVPRVDAERREGARLVAGQEGA